MIVDMRRVMAGDGGAGEQMREQPSTRLGQFIQGERSATVLGEDGEQSRAGRWVQHPDAGRDTGGDGGEIAKRERGGADERADGKRECKAGEVWGAGVK